jgi:Activator of Hsp90 ATPase homolog 1-like protein
MTGEPAAVEHRIQVALSVEQAFDLFVHGMERWWPFASHSCGGADAHRVSFEPGVGGTVTEHTRSGATHPWGRLTAWDPPAHFAMTWHPAQAPALATQLSVHFSTADGGCVIDLRHDGRGVRGADAAAIRDNYQPGWAMVLGRFAAAAATGAT